MMDRVAFERLFLSAFVTPHHGLLTANIEGRLLTNSISHH